MTSETFTVERAAQVKRALAGAGIYLEPTGLQVEGDEVILLRGTRHLAKLSTASWSLLETELAEGIEAARARANPPPPTIGGKKPTYEADPAAPRPIRCPTCRGGFRRPALVPLTRQPCSSTYHRATAPRTP